MPPIRSERISPNRNWGNSDKHMPDDPETEMDESKKDLADRYQEMLDSQLEAISNFDTKAWRAARLNGILLGVFITAVSLFPGRLSIQLTVESAPILFALVAGLFALATSLIFASICILSTFAGFGLSVNLADKLNDGSLDPDAYAGIVIKSYSKNIEENIKVMNAKGQRLRISLTSLVIGLVALATGASFFIIQFILWQQIVILVLVALILVGLSYYLLTMGYSVLDDEDFSTSVES